MTKHDRVDSHAVQPDAISAEELDRRFDDGEDVSAYFDFAAARRPGIEKRRVGFDLPGWMVQRLDREATKLGVSRQSLIKIWLADRLSAAE